MLFIHSNPLRYLSISTVRDVAVNTAMPGKKKRRGTKWFSEAKSIPQEKCMNLRRLLVAFRFCRIIFSMDYFWFGT